MKAEERQELLIKLLESLNQSGEKNDTIRDILLLIKKYTGFQAVGIRLREGEDYPYYETSGFTEEFVEAERNLCVYTGEDELVRDFDGFPVLECLCGNIIRNRMDYNMKYIAKGSSLWINDSTEFMASISHRDSLAYFRGRCFSEGYESVALIPLSSDGDIIGLLQLNDRRKNMFTCDMIQYFEGIGASIGIAMNRKLAEESLQKSEYEHRDLYNYAPNAYFTVGIDGVIRRCNKKAGEILGFDVMDITGKSVFSLYADTLHGKVKASNIFERFRAGERITDEELQMQRSDGTPVWISLTNNPVMDEYGRVVESRSMVVDITNHKEAKEALEKSEERYKLAQRAANIGSWDWDITTGNLEWSETIEPMFGFKRGEFGSTYEAFLECVHPCDRENVIDSVNACIEFDEEYSIEHRIIWPDGTIRWISENGDVVRDKDGNAIRMLGIVQDITKRKEADDVLKKYQDMLDETVKERTTELRRVNEQLHREIAERKLAEVEKSKAYAELNQIFNTITIGVVSIDREFNYINFNKKFIKMFHLDRNNIRKTKCFDVWNESRCKTSNCPMERVLNGERDVEYEISKLLPDGNVIKCLVHSVPYISKEEEIYGIIQYYIDVTEKEQIQREVLQISEQERHRIGNDLHDILGQNLTAIAFLVEALRQKVPEKLFIDVSDNIEKIDRLIGSAIVQTRKITRMLCPVEMERRGLKSALEEMAASTEEIFNVSCKLLQKGYFIVDDIQIATHLFYIAREAVNNAIKHGKPKNIYIYLSSDELYTSMIIRDDGKGITDTKVDSGMGLRIMRYRANIIGAEFYTGNHEDGGYQLEIRLKR